MALLIGMPCRLASLLVLGLVCAAHGQDISDVPSPDNFYRRGGTTATVLGNYVYIDGGEVSQLIDGLEPNQQSRVANRVNTTIGINLSESWTTSDVSMRQIAKPWAAKRTQTIWTDLEAGHYYLWGGEWISGKRTEPDDTLWKFTPDGDGGSWAMETPKNPALFQQLAVTRLGAFASTNKTGFVIGGVASGLTDLGRVPSHNQAVPGMMAFNMKTRVWEDGTTGFSPIDGTLVGASAQWVPNLGPNGLILVLGGIAPAPIQDTKFADAPAFNFHNLTFFDPETKQAYWQIATGDIPPNPRSKFCVTGFQNTDGGYEIFLSGGTDYATDYVYADAYILSLPGFVWTQVPDSPSGKRRMFSCVSVGRRQVLSIGGTPGNYNQKDRAALGLQLFDMTELKWKSSYDANAAAYQRAPDIDAWYTSGSLDNVEWSSDQVRRLFTTNNPTDPSSSSSPSPSDSPSGDSAAVNDSQDSVPVGAIAGGVVGGVAGLALLAAGGWMFMRRRKHKASQLSANDDYHPPGTYAPEVASPSTGPQKWHNRGAELQGSWVERPELAADREFVELPGGRQ